ncbi:MAG: hypothetical protein WA040_19490 [Anaerolineae bacterium]
MEKSPWGARVSSLSALVIVVAFFLPWVSIFCNGSLLVTLRGAEIASGVEPRLFLPSQIAQGRPVLYLLPLAAGVCLLVAISAFLRSRFDVSHAVMQVVMSLIGLLVVGLIFAQMYYDLNRREGGWFEYQVRMHPGFWMTLIGLLGMIVGAMQSLVAVQQSREDGFDDYQGDADDLGLL